MNRSLNLLILNRCFPPEIGATGKVAQDFGRVLGKKHLTTILVGGPVGLEAKDSPSQIHPKSQNSFHIEHLGNTTFSHRRLIGRVFNYVTYLILALYRSVTIRPKPDVIVAMTDPPLACVVGLLTRFVRKCKFVYNIQDLHPDMAVAAGMVRSGFFVRLWERAHNWVLGRCDLIIVPGRDMKERIQTKGFPVGPVIVIPNGSEPLHPPVQSDHPIMKEIRGDFPFTLIHAGNLGYAGSWETILDVAHRLSGENIGIVFVGDGVMRPRLEALSINLPHVRFFDYWPHDDLPYVLGAGDFHIVTVRRGLEGLLVPSKMYTILMSGRPILAITPEICDVSRLVRNSQCGLVANPDDPESIAQCVLYARDHPEELAEMGVRAKELGKKFNRNDLAKDFLRAIEETVTV